jgi:DNA-3-methyladenine glycosylase II
MSPRASTRPPALTRPRLRDAITHLTDVDPKLGPVIAAVGPCTLLPDRRGTHFSHLARSIVYQQLTGSAAATIHARVIDAAGGELTAESVRVLPVETLRAAGLSQAKTRALHDLAERVHDGRLTLDGLEALSDDAIIAQCVAVRGIGPWTAQMFLMFRLGRPDVLPVLDLGVRKGAMRVHRLRSLPDAARLEQLARPWAPWRSVASWYCWRALELETLPR